MAYQLYSFSPTIASRGYHVYMHTTWLNAYDGERVLVEIETNAESKMVDPYCCAVKIKNNLQIWTTVGHIPREISRFVFYFIQDEGGNVEGTLLSTVYPPSPIPAGGLEVPVKLIFSCRRYITHQEMVDFINRYDYNAEIEYVEEPQQSSEHAKVPNSEEASGNEGEGSRDLESSSEDNNDEDDDVDLLITK